MNCEHCGKPLEPAPARFDGEPTTVGYLPCKCSRTAWMNCQCAEYGFTLADHREYCAGVQPNAALTGGPKTETSKHE